MPCIKLGLLNQEVCIVHYSSNINVACISMLLMMLVDLQPSKIQLHFKTDGISVIAIMLLCSMVCFSYHSCNDQWD